MRFFRRFQPLPLAKILDPAHGGLRDLSPQELAEYIAGWAPGTMNRILGEAEFRRRERWSGPVILSLGMSGGALIISIAALLSS